MAVAGRRIALALHAGVAWRWNVTQVHRGRRPSDVHGVREVVHADHGFLPHGPIPERETPVPRPIGWGGDVVDGLEKVTPLWIEADVHGHTGLVEGAMGHEMR